MTAAVVGSTWTVSLHAIPGCETHSIPSETAGKNVVPPKSSLKENNQAN